LKPDGKRRGIALLKWGLVAYWAESATKGPRPINVRAETVAYKFGEQLRQKRCLIPASGFYEWRTVGGEKQACHFALRNCRPFAFAGLWDLWAGERQKLLTCYLVNTAANDLVREVHDRMPCLLPPASYGEWLDPQTPVERLTAILRPYPADEMQ